MAPDESLQLGQTLQSAVQRSARPAAVLAVGSGKGGVGKTTVSVNLAVALARAGAAVGLLDADVYGPNVPLMLGVTQLPPLQEGQIVPATAHGVKLISMGFFLKPDEPVIWRGPMLHGVIQKFLKEVVWGPLDYLLVDLPPGCLTADALVATTQGPVPINKVQAGDHVYSFDGRISQMVRKSPRQVQANLIKRRVVAVVPQGTAEVYELKTPTRCLRGTADHPVLILRRRREGPSRYFDYHFEWEHLTKVTTNDRLVVVKKLPQDAGTPLKLPPLISAGKTPLRFPEYSSDEFSRVVGYFLGDGTVRTSHGKYWGVWFSEPESGRYRARYVQSLKESFGFTHVHQQPGKFAALSSRLAELFDRLGLHEPALQKTIPRWVYTLPASQKLALIEGYCDADGHRRCEKIGHRRPGWMVFESPNAQLIKGLRALSMDVGLKVSNLNHRTRTIRVPSTGQALTRTFYNFEANKLAKTDTYGAGLIRGSVGRGLIHEYLGFERVKSVKSVGIEEVYDLQVEGEHNFVANGLIVHNTGDVQLTLSQTIPLTGAVIVTTPQDVALLDVRKAMAMFEKVRVPLIGIIENMSTFVCPSCRTETPIFRRGGGRAAAERAKVPLLGEIPLVPSVCEHGDAGTPIVAAEPDSPVARAFTDAARQVAERARALAAAGSPQFVGL